MVWITATEALDILKVLPQTLYANVSRGKIRAQPSKVDGRRSLYNREDVIRMARRTNGRRTVAKVAAEAIGWGDPVLPTAISTVVNGRLWYRGQDAAVLSRTESLEDIASLLWDCQKNPFENMTTSTPLAIARDPEFKDVARAAFLAMSARCVEDSPSIGRTLRALREEAASVLETLVQAMLGFEGEMPAGTLSKQIAVRWARPDAEDIVRRALVLLADHELNASAFAVRVAISTGSSLAAGILAGLATLIGPLHGGASIALHDLIKSIDHLGVEAAVLEWLKQGGTLPGFGHPLYPDGDIRATTLLGLLPVSGTHAQLQKHVEGVLGEVPNIDFALSVITETFDLPAAAPFVLFAIGRCVGWLAQALEQVETQRLIRPRARYVGIDPKLANGLQEQNV